MTARHPEAPSALRAKVLAYLHAHHVMTVATAEPWAAAVFYVNDGFTLYYLSSPRSRHARQLATDPRAAATVHEDYDDWRQIRGVQLEGTVHAVEPAGTASVRALYAAKFPLVATPGAENAAIAAALARIEWYALNPTRVCFVDNSVGFGHRDEIILGGTGPS